jgi:hypothetical protein
MRKRNTTCGICAVLFTCTFGLRAELIKEFELHFGPNALTVDTATGLGWLNLSFSAGLSYDAARAATQTGGAFSGFRMAQAAEVLTLYQSAGFFGPGWFPEGGAFDEAIKSLISLLGPTGFQEGRPEVLGICDTSTNPGSHLVPGLDISFQAPSYGYSVTGGTFGTLSYGDTTSDPAVGVWLVTPVPEPSVATLILVGAVLFWFQSSRLTGRKKGLDAEVTLASSWADNMAWLCLLSPLWTREARGRALPAPTIWPGCAC